MPPSLQFISIRSERGPDDYKVPERFFERTYLTQGLKSFASEVLRRLSGEKTETSAIFHMITIADFDRYSKVLERLGKAVILSAEGETSEIMRRRLFERGGVPDDGKKVASEFAGRPSASDS